MDGANWSKRLLWGGVAGLVLGTGPLVLIALLDPKSNPIGPGLLAFFSFWPSVGCVVAGLASVWPVLRRPSSAARRDPERGAL